MFGAFYRNIGGDKPCTAKKKRKKKRKSGKKQKMMKSGRKI